MSPRRLAFRVEYDGTDFHGWQQQPGARTVQGVLEAAIAEALGGAPRVDGASRTDAGVHARDQWAATTIDHPIVASGFVKAVNRRLPDDVALRNAEDVALDFLPRFSNAGKTYCYRLYLDTLRRPLVDRFAWRVPWALDLDRLAAGLPALLGTHDFSAFAASDGSHTSAVRTVTALTLGTEPAGVTTLVVEGTAFLKHMVRNLVGTLVDVGRGRLAPEDCARILESRDRRLAGATAPARGLTLERVHPKG